MDNNNLEILLDSKSCCNLTTVNTLSFVDINGNLNLDGLLKAQKLSARAGLRMACVEMEMHSWNENLKRDRLVGCSLTGWKDMVNATQMSKEDEASLLKLLKEAVESELKTYSNELGVVEPLLSLTVKPEGSLSQLPTVSSGAHWNYSPYYIRRVRVTNGQPVLKVLEELGYPIHIEVGQTEENCTRKVVEFAVKSPEGRTRHDVSAIEQLENYKMFMDNYTTHNTSITVDVRANEWEGVEQWLWDNWDSIIGISFLSLDENFYQLLPYESITKEQYELMKLKERPFDALLLSKYESEEFVEDDLTDDGCTTGACAVR